MVRYVEKRLLFRKAADGECICERCQSVSVNMLPNRVSVTVTEYLLHSNHFPWANILTHEYSMPKVKPSAPSRNQYRHQAQ